MAAAGEGIKNSEDAGQAVLRVDTIFVAQQMLRTLLMMSVGRGSCLISSCGL